MKPALRVCLKAIPVLALAAAAASLVDVRRVGLQPDGSILIPTGQTLTPAGAHIEVSDRPLGMVPSPDGALLAVVTGSNFAPRRLHILDTQTKSAVQAIPIGDSFVGVAFDAAGKTLYVGGGHDNDVKIFERGQDGAFRLASSISLPASAPSGLALAPGGRTLYVALNLKHAVAIVDTVTRAVTEVPAGSYPYTVAASGAKVYVSNWGGRRPAAGDATFGDFPVVLDPRTGIPSSGTVSVIDSETRRVTREIEVGLHPSAMALSPAGDRLYVANANSDTVSVIDTRSDRVVRTINVRLDRKAPL